MLLQQSGMGHAADLVHHLHLRAECHHPRDLSGRLDRNAPALRVQAGDDRAAWQMRVAMSHGSGRRAADLRAGAMSGRPDRVSAELQVCADRAPCSRADLSGRPDRYAAELYASRRPNLPGRSNRYATEL